MSDLNQARNASLRKSWKLDEGTRSEIAGVMNTWSSGRGSGRCSRQAAVIVSMWDGMQIYDALHPGVLDVPAILRRELETAFGLA